MAFGDYNIKTAGGMFLKIESGKPQVIRLLQDNPSMKIIHGFGKTEENCEGEGCTMCLEKDEKGVPNNKARKRFKLNIYNHETERVMIWDFGTGVMKLIQDVEEVLKSQGINILDTDIIVNARGDKMDKKYSVQPMMKSKTIPTGLALFSIEEPMPF